jgi:hypothetical protein
MLAKTTIEKNQQILKKLLQGVNVSLKRQVCGDLSTSKSVTKCHAQENNMLGQFTMELTKRQLLEL